MFSQDVIKQLGSYVYRLIDPRNGQTFYVGKGKGNRVFDHVNKALKGLLDNSNTEADEDYVSAKIQQIRDIKRAGLEVIHVIHRYGLSDEEALEVEAALIDAYPGLTNIQSGYDAERGVNNVEVLQRILSETAFEDVPALKYCIIKIPKNEDADIYEAVRKHWRVDVNHIRKIPYVLAVRDGIVAEVYKVDKWYDSDVIPGRYMFDGKVADDEIRKLFVNKRIPEHYTKKGMASPIIYHD